MPTPVHQYVNRLAYGDPLAERCLEQQGRLWLTGRRSELFAREVSPELREFARQVESPPSGDGALVVAVGDDPERAFREAGVEIAAARPLSLVVLSSQENDGIRPFALALADGLRRDGHRVTFRGVRRADDADLFAAVAAIPATTDAVIVEHEFSLFRDVSFVRALASLRRRGIAAVLSIHELEPGKFHHYRLLTKALHYRQRFPWPLEAARVIWVGLRLAWRFLRFRAVLWGLGELPARIVIHSARSRPWVDLLTSDLAKVEEIPLIVRPLEGVAVADDTERRRLRAQLGLPLDAFIFVSPGFFFRRKRFIELISVAPRDAIVVLSGTESDLAESDRGYLDEIRRYVAERGLTNVVINTDFNTMGEHVAASDCVVLYYEDVFQSGVATQAIWAELPCVFSDLPSFQLYRAGGLFAKDTVELRRRLHEVRDPATYQRLREGARFLKRFLAPERLAPRYLVDLPRR